MSKSKWLQVRLTESEHQRLGMGAEAVGLSVSEHVRVLLFGKVESVKAVKKEGLVCERCGAEVEKLTMDREMKRVCYGCALG